jgi:hypothetical protein
MRQHPTRGRTLLALAMLFAALLTLALRSVTVAQSATALRPESFDEAGVRAAVSKRIEGRTAFSARLSAESFADDAVWINAFGRRLVGRANIEKFFTELYADRGFVGADVTEQAAIDAGSFRLEGALRDRHR